MSYSRGYVHVNGRRIHYRRWGSGPAVLAIHGSPQSSRALAPIAARFAEHGLCTITPDTPGNGLSEQLSLSDDVSTADFARSLFAFADALGLGRVGLYGFHTGAAIACTFAALYPERTAAAVFEGLPAWTESERIDALARYLPPFIPQWDGSHMAWVWARMEEQALFFPWHSAELRARIDYDVPVPEAVHANCMDLLDSGDGYRQSYRAAFNFKPNLWLMNVAAPLMICARETDVLCGHLDRAALHERTPRRFKDAASLHAAAADHLWRHAGDAAPTTGSGGVDSRGLSRGFVANALGPMAWIGRLEGSLRPLLFLHEAGDSAAKYSELVADVGGSRPVIAVHLPGHGDSQDAVFAEGQASDAPHVADYAGIVGEVCKALGLVGYAAAGIHFGGQIAMALAQQRHAYAGATFGASRHGQECAALDPADESLSTVWDGAHLLRAFRIARWERLFHPWFRRDRAHARRPFGDLNSTLVQARAVCLLKANRQWLLARRAESAFDLLFAARAVERFTAFAIADDPLSDAAHMQSLPGRVQRVPAENGEWRSVLAAFAAS